MSAVNTTRGASFAPGNLKSRSTTQARKPFDVKEWHRRKAAEAQAKRKRERQIETCYKQHVPPQVQYAPETLTAKQESIERMMRSNRAVGL